MGMGGGMPGGDMGMGGGMPMSPAAEGGKVMKQGKGGNAQEMSPEEMAAMSPMVKLTRIEQSMAGMLTEVMSNLGINAQQVIKAQFPIENPKGGKPFLLDFAIPPIKLAVECDGEIWHGQPEQELEDQERDNLLAQRGWSVLRFDDKAIEESPQAVKQTVSSYTQTLMQGPQKHASSNGNGHKHNVYLFSIDEEGRLKNCHRDYGKYFGRLKSYLGQGFGQTPNGFSVTEYNKQASSKVFQQ